MRLQEGDNHPFKKHMKNKARRLDLHRKRRTQNIFFFSQNSSLCEPARLHICFLIQNERGFEKQEGL